MNYDDWKTSTRDDIDNPEDEELDEEIVDDGISEPDEDEELEEEPEEDADSESDK